VQFDLKSWLTKQVGDNGFDLPAVDVSVAKADSGCEFVVTNGLGSFVSGGRNGENSRRYHGFVFATKPPVGRLVLFSRVDEKVTVNGGIPAELATNLWRQAVAPQGYTLLEAFSVYPLPTWVFRLPEGRLVKQLSMIAGKQQAVVGYTWLPDDSSSKAQVELALFANHRDFHGETRGADSWRFQQTPGTERLSVKAFDNATEIVIRYDRGDYRQDAVWYWGYHWPRECERGLNDGEDCYRLGFLTATLEAGQCVSLVVQLDNEPERVDNSVVTIDDAARRAWQRQKELLSKAGNPTDPYQRQLVLAADQFLVHRDSTNGATVVAGYHWFSDWGRDSMISLPGLTLATGRSTEAKSILETFGRYESDGMLPNFFPDSGQAPEYNTADATLWWAWALKQYFDATGDIAFVRRQLPLLQDVVAWHKQGTRHNLKLDTSDGLITAGEKGTQLTWMDAKVGDLVVTPRQGKPVEINALWYNFLRTVAELLRKSVEVGGIADPDEVTRKAAEFDTMAAQTKQGMAKFWNADKGCLYDVILQDGSKDAAVRPNQLIALSLPYTAFSQDEGEKILAVVERELLTPYGLRTLAPCDPAYKGRYGGGLAQANQYERDITYHQGTVWPWLFGPWVEARLKSKGTSAENVSEVLGKLGSVMKHVLGDAGLGSVSEICDGDWPHTARGCIAQAWSVAELLRTRKRLLELLATMSSGTSTAQ
jgi:predicted glycogen debranching enzyme